MIMTNSVILSNWKCRFSHAKWGTF